MARVDTVIHGPRSQVSAAHGIQQHPYFWYFVAAGVFLLILVVGILWAMYRGSPDAKTSSTSRSSAKTLFVGNQKQNGPDDFSTIKDALARARPGDRIVVQKDIHEEHLQIEDRRWGKGLTIQGEGPGGKSIVWRLPKTSKEKVLLELHNTEGIRVKGFTFDGDGRTDDLVVLFGQCPGLTLEDISFQGFKRSAINILHCAGAADRPVTLVNLRAVTIDKAEAALLFNFRESIKEPRGNNHIRVSDSVFVGPFQAAVELTGPEQDIEFRANRFFGAENGFLYKPGKTTHPLQMAVVSNTLCRLQTGLTLESLPAPANPIQASSVVVEKNLFTQTAVIAKVDSLPSGEQLKNGETLQSLAGQLIRSSRNVRDPSSQEGNVIINAFAVPFPPLPQDPKDMQHFLRYSKKSPLVEHGSPGVPPEE